MPADPADPAQPLPPLLTGTDLPPLEELLEHATVVAQPMSTRFRGTTVREALLLRGSHGWAEFSPFPEYGPQESSRWLAAAASTTMTARGRTASRCGSTKTPAATAFPVT